jgi:hypothetical protein
MTRGLSHFRQADLVKALRAMRAAGVKAERIEVAVDGKINIVLAENCSNKNENPWDEVLRGSKDENQI